MRALRVVQQRTAAIRDRVCGAVSAELSNGDLLAATRLAHRELDAVADREIARDAERRPACSAGCSYCCHVHVDATRAEVLAVAQHLREHRSESELATLIERLDAQVRLVSAMDHDARWSAKIPCALLGDDGLCTIHEARPIRCRAFHSYSVDACREAFAGESEPELVTNRELDRACDAAEQGFERALSEHGHSNEAVLLEPTLLEALVSQRSPPPERD